MRFSFVHFYFRFNSTEQVLLNNRNFDWVAGIHANIRASKQGLPLLNPLLFNRPQKTVEFLSSSIIVVVLSSVYPLIIASYQFIGWLGQPPLDHARAAVTFETGRVHIQPIFITTCIFVWGLFNFPEDCEWECASDTANWDELLFNPIRTSHRLSTFDCLALAHFHLQSSHTLRCQCWCKGVVGA